MFGSQSISSDTKKQKNRKDFLYKIAKLKQNRILKDRQNLIEYHQEEQKKQKIQNLSQDQQQEFDMVIPFAELHQAPTNQFIQTTNTKKQLKQLNWEQKKENDEQKNKISVKGYQPTYLYSNESKQQIIEKEQKVLDRQTQKPFTFDDIDDQENEIVQNSQKQIQCNKNDINNNQIKKQHLKQVSSDNQDSSSSEEEQQIKGMSITSNSLQGNVVIKITNKKQLILSRLPPGIILKCIIRKSSDYFNPQFDFYLNNGLKHIISAKKYSLAKKQIFKLSLELGKYKQKDTVGSIIANTVHNTYWIYQQNMVQDQVNYQLKGLVRYQKKLKAHRQMKVNLFINDQCPMIVDPQRLGQQAPHQNGLFLKNYQLQPKQSSIKNYSLYDEQDKEYQYLKMTKISENMFEVYIQHPLSPMQALSICLTRFDAQLK